MAWDFSTDPEFAKTDAAIQAVVAGGCKDPLVLAFQCLHIRVVKKEDRPKLEAAYAALKESKRNYAAIPAFVSPPPQVLDICTLPIPARLVGQ